MLLKQSENKMKIKEITETATVGGTSAGAIATVASPVAAHAKPKKRKNGAPVAPQATKPNGTVKNALDMPNNIMGGKPIKR
jgi:alkaline phosphatase